MKVDSPHYKWKISDHVMLPSAAQQGENQMVLHQDCMVDV